MSRRPLEVVIAVIAVLSAAATLAFVAHAFVKSPQNPVAAEIGFERVLANRLAIAGGVLTGHTEGEIVDSSAKLDALLNAREELGLTPDQVMAVGDGANDIPMIEAAGLGVGYRPKPKLAAVADATLRFSDLTALLWAQGIPKKEWMAD
jgi:phosphoserine phosphatase